MCISLEDAVKWFAAGAAVVGAGYTAVQYDRAKRWRAGDLAQRLLSLLGTDDELSLACHVIDWGVGPLVVPARYRGLLETPPADPARPSPRDRGEVIQLNLDLMQRAVQVRLAFDPKSEPEGLVYRYCFDKLFSHLSEVQSLLESHQLKIEDLGGFVYWLVRIETYEYAPHGTGAAVFQPFLKHEPFGYRRVIELGKQLGVQGWSYAPP